MDVKIDSGLLHSYYACERTHNEYGLSGECVNC